MLNRTAFALYKATHFLDVQITALFSSGHHFFVHQVQSSVYIKRLSYYPFFLRIQKISCFVQSECGAVEYLNRVLL